MGFWSSVPLAPGMDAAHHNRWVEDEVDRLGGRKSLYSTSFYDEDRFWALYNGPVYRGSRSATTRMARLLDLYDKCVGSASPERQVSRRQGGANRCHARSQVAPVLSPRSSAPGSARSLSRPSTEARRVRPTPFAASGSTSPRALNYVATAPSDLGLARAYVSGTSIVDGDMFTALDAHVRGPRGQPCRGPTG